MLWFRQKDGPKYTLDAENCGLSIGQVVEHKVTGRKAVIVALYEQNSRQWATVSVGWTSNDEFDTTVSEIKPFVEPASTNAVDPHVE